MAPCLYVCFSISLWKLTMEFWYILEIHYITYTARSLEENFRMFIQYMYVHIMYLTVKSVEITRDVFWYCSTRMQICISRGEIFYLPTSSLISSCNKYRTYWKIGFSASVLWKEFKRWIFHLSTISSISGCVLYSTIMMRLNMDFPLALLSADFWMHSQIMSCKEF
jgi:hypothetical protein